METPKQIAGFVLAGGGSSRMGRDKALLELEGVALVVRTAKLVESVSGAPVAIIGAPDAYGSLGLRVIGDDFPGTGPLGGLATALRASSAAWNLIVACDLPYLTREWVKYLIGCAAASKADAVVPMNELGAEPLCAMYNRSCEPAIRTALVGGTRKVTDGLAGVRVERIAPSAWKAFDSEGYLFKNMNSPADYEEAKIRLGAPAKP